MRTLTALPFAIAAGVIAFVGVLRLVRSELRREREARKQAADWGVN
jgi:hypothetical protein